MSKFMQFANKSGEHTVIGVYMFTSLCGLLHMHDLPAVEFVQVCTMVILAVFTGNSFKHYFEIKNGAVDATPDDSKHS